MKLNQIMIIVLLAILMALALASCRQHEEPITAAELLTFGERFLLERDYVQALVQFRRVIEIESMNPRGYTGAAEAYIGLGQLDNAVAVLQQGIERTGDVTVQQMLSYIQAPPLISSINPQDEYEEDAYDPEVSQEQNNYANDDPENEGYLDEELAHIPSPVMASLLYEISQANAAGDGLKVLRLMSTDLFFDYFTCRELAVEITARGEVYEEIWWHEPMHRIEYRDMSIYIWYVQTASSINIHFGDYSCYGIPLNWASVRQAFPGSSHFPAWWISGGDWYSQWYVSGDGEWNYERRVQYSISPRAGRDISIFTPYYWLETRSYDIYGNLDWYDTTRRSIIRD